MVFGQFVLLHGGVVRAFGSEFDEILEGSHGYVEDI